jgi:hypothetical protein
VDPAQLRRGLRAELEVAVAVVVSVGRARPENRGLGPGMLDRLREAAAGHRPADEIIVESIVGYQAS